MKKLKIVIPALIILLTLIYYMFLRSGVTDADLLFVNGVVYTVNDRFPVAEAVAVTEGRIAGVGTAAEIQRKFRFKQVIDLKGRPLFPGFIDSHAHLEGLGSYLLNLDLFGTGSVEEIRALIRERVMDAKPGMWIRGRGWDQNKWKIKEFPTREMLDDIANDVPVYLIRADGHAVWVNGKVMDVAGFGAATVEPEGGRILRDARGEPTGVFIDNARDMLDAKLPIPAEEERTEAILSAIQSFLRVGVTDVHDMGVDGEVIAIYEKLIASGRFPIRVYAAIDGPGATWDHYVRTGPDVGGHGGRLTVRALKLYADGALGSRGAALIEPYSDDPANRGLTLTGHDSILHLGEQALEKGFQLCVHAIGDRANHIALNVFDELSRLHPDKAADARFRVEHAQVISLADIPRFARVSVLPMMQPIHCTSDMPWAEQRLGPERIKGAYAWRSLIDSGSIIPASSDSPNDNSNPLWGFYAAITRQDATGRPKGGWYHEQRMTREEALKAFTVWGAFAAFEETKKGTIEPGKVADLVVLSADIMKIPTAEILQTTVEMTMVGGEVVYSAGGFAVQRD